MTNKEWQKWQRDMCKPTWEDYALWAWVAGVGIGLIALMFGDLWMN